MPAYTLPESLRVRLAKPMGRLFSAAEIGDGSLKRSASAASLVVSVGDRVTETLASEGRVPDVQIVDGKENRKKRDPPAVAHVVSIGAASPPGAITWEAIEAIGRAFAGRKPARVLVDGEEDLLALPAVVLAPFGAVVYYGQPGEGIVEVRADHAAKSRSRKVLSEMGVPELR